MGEQIVKLVFSIIAKVSIKLTFAFIGISDRYDQSFVYHQLYTALSDESLKNQASVGSQQLIS